MIYLVSYAALASIAAVVFFLRWRDAEAKLRMPILPLIAMKKRKAKAHPLKGKPWKR